MKAKYMDFEEGEIVRLKPLEELKVYFNRARSQKGVPESLMKRWENTFYKPIEDNYELISSLDIIADHFIMSQDMGECYAVRDEKNIINSVVYYYLPQCWLQKK